MIEAFTGERGGGFGKIKAILRAPESSKTFQNPRGK
jgi:hypothetical protein